MPRVLSHTPAWLSRPSPGYHLFEPTPSGNHVPTDKQKSTGLRRPIATRDSEVFVAVGREIRWADLAQLKEDDAPQYRKLAISLHLPVQRLTISPAGDYLAVSTSHTVHIVTLPDSSLLNTDDPSPIKPKTFQVGPTTHVLEESPIASILWHPLGYRGRCLVTVTLEGVVRLWEINRADRLSFSEPTLSIDLVKLATAEDYEDDLSASYYGASKGFSVDMAYLEVASACFGDSPDQEGAHGWAPMTLWIATVAGEVYALCPLLPNKWQLPESHGAATLLQTLVTSIDINYADVSDDQEATPYERATVANQLSWKSDIIYHEPLEEVLANGDTIKVFPRPASVPAIPLLQGPFTIKPAVDNFELSDMAIYSLKTFSDGGEEGEIAEGLPAAVVCLLTDTCQVHVCFDAKGIEGKWLPLEGDECTIEPIDHTLIVAETITLVDNAVSSNKQSITSDVHTDFSFFVSHGSGVYYISLESWIRKLETELSNPKHEGTAYRLRTLISETNTKVERCLRRQPGDEEREATSCVIVEDGIVGYMMLTTLDNEPQAITFDAPEDGLWMGSDADDYEFVSTPGEVRDLWNPRKELWETFDLYAALNIPNRHRSFLKDEIRLSPANLELLMSAHRVLSTHTDKLQHAVSNLFNRCQRLQDEYRAEIFRTSRIAAQIDAITGEDEKGSETAGSARMEERLQKVKVKQEALNARYQSLRRKAGGIQNPQISEKESAFTAELQTLESSLDPTKQTLTDDVDGRDVPAWQRLNSIKETKASLAQDVEKAVQSDGTEGERTNARVNVPSHSRKLENEQVQKLLQHQTDLLEATANRLKDFGIAVPNVSVEGGG